MIASSGARSPTKTPPTDLKTFETDESRGNWELPGDDQSPPTDRKPPPQAAPIRLPEPPPAPFPEIPESNEKPEKETPPASVPPARTLFGTIKELFGKVAEAVTGKPTPSLAAKRKRRREETGRAFQFARALTKKIKRSIWHFLYSPAPYDPEAERAYAEQVLREQMEEWNREDDQEPDESFHYASHGGFDLHP